MATPRLKSQLEAAKATDSSLHQQPWDPSSIDRNSKALEDNALFSANPSSRADSETALVKIRSAIRNGSTEAAYEDIGAELLKRAFRRLLVSGGARIGSPVAFPLSRCALDTAHLLFVHIAEKGEATAEERRDWSGVVSDFKKIVVNSGLVKAGDASSSAILLHICALQNGIAGMADKEATLKLASAGVTLGIGLVKSAISMSVSNDVLNAGLSLGEAAIESHRRGHAKDLSVAFIAFAKLSRKIRTEYLITPTPKMSELITSTIQQEVGDVFIKYAASSKSWEVCAAFALLLADVLQAAETFPPGDAVTNDLVQWLWDGDGEEETPDSKTFPGYLYYLSFGDNGASQRKPVVTLRSSIFDWARQLLEGSGAAGSGVDQDLFFADEWIMNGVELVSNGIGSKIKPLNYVDVYRMKIQQTIKSEEGREGGSGGGERKRDPAGKKLLREVEIIIHDLEQDLSLWLSDTTSLLEPIDGCEKVSGVFEALMGTMVKGNGLAIDRVHQALGTESAEEIVANTLEVVQQYSSSGGVLANNAPTSLDVCNALDICGGKLHSIGRALELLLEVREAIPTKKAFSACRLACKKGAWLVNRASIEVDKLADAALALLREKTKVGGGEGGSGDEVIRALLADLIDKAQISFAEESEEPDAVLVRSLPAFLKAHVNDAINSSLETVDVAQNPTDVLLDMSRGLFFTLGLHSILRETNQKRVAALNNLKTGLLVSIQKQAVQMKHQASTATSLMSGFLSFGGRTPAAAEAAAITAREGFVEIVKSLDESSNTNLELIGVRRLQKLARCWLEVGPFRRAIIKSANNTEELKELMRASKVFIKEALQKLASLVVEELEVISETLKNGLPSSNLRNATVQKASEEAKAAMEKAAPMTIPPMLTRAFSLGGALTDALIDITSSTVKESYRVRELAAIYAKAFESSSLLQDRVSRALISRRALEHNATVVAALQAEGKLAHDITRFDDPSTTAAAAMSNNDLAVQEELVALRSALGAMAVQQKNLIDLIQTRLGGGSSSDAGAATKEGGFGAPSDSITDESVSRDAFIAEESAIAATIGTRLENIDNLTNTAAAAETDLVKKMQCLVQSRRECAILQKIEENLSVISNKLDIVIDIVETLKEKLIEIDSKLDNITQAVAVLRQDLLRLAGLPVLDVVEFWRKRRLLSLQSGLQTEVFIRPSVVKPGARGRFQVDEANPSVKLETAIHEWLSSHESVCVLSGQAGSGKSTALRDIERYLLGEWSSKNKKHGRTVVVLPISLPALRDPLGNLFDEGALKAFDRSLRQSQVDELRQLVTSEASSIDLILLLDAYDELPSAALGRNLYRTNNLEALRDQNNLAKNKTLPKVIITCRSEYLSELSNSARPFLPVEVGNPSKDDESKASKYYQEMRLAPFTKKRQVFQQQHVALKYRQVFCQEFPKLQQSPSVRTWTHAEGLNAFAEMWVQPTGPLAGMLGVVEYIWLNSNTEEILYDIVYRDGVVASRLPHRFLRRPETLEDIGARDTISVGDTVHGPHVSLLVELAKVATITPDFEDDAGRKGGGNTDAAAATGHGGVLAASDLASRSLEFYNRLTPDSQSTADVEKFSVHAMISVLAAVSELDLEKNFAALHKFTQRIVFEADDNFPELWSVGRYNERYDNMPELNNLTSTPFMIKIVTEILPMLSKIKVGKKNIKSRLDSTLKEDVAGTVFAVLNESDHVLDGRGSGLAFGEVTSAKLVHHKSRREKTMKGRLQQAAAKEHFLTKNAMHQNSLISDLTNVQKSLESDSSDPEKRDQKEQTRRRIQMCVAEAVGRIIESNAAKPWATGSLPSGTVIDGVINKAKLISAIDRNVVAALRRSPTRRANIYNLFLEFWLEREGDKVLISSAGILTSDQLRLEASEFSARLAMYLVEHGISKLTYRQRSNLFCNVRATDSADSKQQLLDIFFSSDPKAIAVRAASPVRYSGGVISFVHKTMQEALVAKSIALHLRDAFGDTLMTSAKVLDLAALFLQKDNLSASPKIMSAAGELRQCQNVLESVLQALENSPLQSVVLGHHDAICDFIADALLEDNVMSLDLFAATWLAMMADQVRNSGAGTKVSLILENIKAIVCAPLARRSGATLLHEAAKEGKELLVLTLVKLLALFATKGNDVIDFSRSTEIMEGGERHATEEELGAFWCSKAKSRKLYLDCRDKLNRTPLYVASLEGQASTVEILLACGCDAWSAPLLLETHLEIMSISHHGEAVAQVVYEDEEDDENEDRQLQTAPFALGLVKNPRRASRQPQTTFTAGLPSALASRDLRTCRYEVELSQWVCGPGSRLEIGWMATTTTKTSTAAADDSTKETVGGSTKEAPVPTESLIAEAPRATDEKARSITIVIEHSSVSILVNGEPIELEEGDWETIPNLKTLQQGDIVVYCDAETGDIDTKKMEQKIRLPAHSSSKKLPRKQSDLAGDGDSESSEDDDDDDDDDDDEDSEDEDDFVDDMADVVGVDAGDGNSTSWIAYRVINEDDGAGSINVVPVQATDEEGAISIPTSRALKVYQDTLCIGAALNIEEGIVYFSIDSEWKKANFQLSSVLESDEEKIYPAVSGTNAGLKIKFNCGEKPFNFPHPSERFNSINQVLDKENKGTENPLRVAINLGHFEVAKLLMLNSKERDEGIHLSLEGEDGRKSPLVLAIERGNFDFIDTLYECGFGFTHDLRQWSPLHYAAEVGSSTMVKLLLQKGLDVNATTIRLNTPLHIAAEHGHQRIVEVLLEKGAHLEAQNKVGNTPMDLAASGKHSEVAKFLLDRRKDGVT